MKRDAAIALIKSHLRQRSGRAWSVTGGRGTDWGWIHILPKPSERRPETGHLLPKHRLELAQLFGLDQSVSNQGIHIPASEDHYKEYVERAKGVQPTTIAKDYWD